MTFNLKPALRSYGIILLTVLSLNVYGQTYHIESVEYVGLKRTKAITLDRELVIQPGMELDSSALRQLTDRTELQLKNLNLFNEIDIRMIPISLANPYKLKCEIHFVEKWYHWPLPFIEFADRNFNQWWQFDLDPSRTNYGIYLFNYNVRGRNQTLKLSLVTGYTRDIGLYYSVPFTSWNNNVGYVLESRYRRNSEIWYSTEDNKLQFLQDLDEDLIKRYLNRGSLFYRLDKRTHVFLSAAFNRIVINDTVLSSERNPNYLADRGTNQNEYAAGASIVRESRDNRLFPWDGHYVSFGYGATVINNTSTILHRIDGRASVYRPLTERFAVAGQIRAKASNLRSAPYRNFKSLGYGDYVRGYENYVIEGQHFGLAKAGIRFALLNEKKYFLGFIPVKNYRHLPVSVFLETFVDAGYVVSNAEYIQNDFQNRWLYGTGIGLNMAFYFDKVFRFEYTRNHLNEYGAYISFSKSF